MDAPTDDELHALLQTVIARLMKMLTRRGVLVEDMGQDLPGRAGCRRRGERARCGRCSRGHHLPNRRPRAGQVLTERRDAARGSGRCAADIDGFSLHAAGSKVTASGWNSCAVAITPGSFRRTGCRSRRRAGAMSQKHTVARATAPVLEPAGVHKGLRRWFPWPRLHLIIRFHGAGAPTPLAVPWWCPQGPRWEERAPQPPASECVVQTETNPDRHRPHRIAWARLLKRVFDIDMQHCPNCGAGSSRSSRAILRRTGDREDPDPPGTGSAAAARGRERGGGKTEAA